MTEWFEKQHAELQGEITTGMADLLNYRDSDFIALDSEEQRICAAMVERGNCPRMQSSAGL
ncbi:MULTISPECIES: hypothetical protein [unclassified Bradyrhizobium]|uniref:hypothetical protein n=1 Tax=unclassified Bradyrhizobium TaxID=2631580 RepID=UPI0020B3C68D|nr:MULTISPECIES: hypothetical protein [unclassified Bradyrhizobium]MCP3397115.1 hypothetical protein [Bradyrhizobium sp. CCGB20]MCP3405628.1 hypothetical protein [Bradyrhizobium sp. CCGB01]